MRSPGWRDSKARSLRLQYKSLFRASVFCDRGERRRRSDCRALARGQRSGVKPRLNQPLVEGTSSLASVIRKKSSGYARDSDSIAFTIKCWKSGLPSHNSVSIFCY
jgi:hypothetical protein